MITLAIDPGPEQSAYCLIEDYRPTMFGKIDNRQLCDWLPVAASCHRVAIEMIACYGMAVGAEVFDTAVWIGRFDETIRRAGVVPLLVKRPAIKVHHCHSARASDANIRQALVDRFAHGQPNYGKGTKAEPGFFHGFADDVWQAMALAVYVSDQPAQVLAVLR